MGEPVNIRYTSTAIALHWLVALLIFAGFGLGITMTEMSFGPQKLKFYSWHKWIGITVFALVAVRLVWRLMHTPPAYPPSMPAWQQTVAHASHWLMYVLFFLIPLSGWLFSSAKGFQTVYLGVLPLPDLLSKETGEIILSATDPENPFTVAELIRLFHKGMNLTLLGLVIAHVGAALKHHFIDRDDILKRMMPGRRVSN
jgi:cytochrome b561